MCEFCRHSPHLAGCPNAPDPRTVFICSECGEMIYEGDWFYRVLGETYCEDCMDGMKELAEAVEEEPEERWLRIAREIYLESQTRDAE